MAFWSLVGPLAGSIPAGRRLGLVLFLRLLRRLGLRPRRRPSPKATPPPPRRRLRQRCPEVGLGLLDQTRDRGKARGDVFGVLDFWAG